VFERKAVFEIPQGKLVEDDFTMEMIDAGAEDVLLEDGFFTVTAPMEDFGHVHHKLDQMKITADEAGLERVPLNFKEIDKEAFKVITKLVDMLEADDDVVKVYHNVQYHDSFAE
jgi:transcriptional/translational regulatory protein YebC/TACO1